MANKIISGVDESIAFDEKVVFFGKLSDITVLPDWFKDDEDKNTARYKERWNYILDEEVGLGIIPSQHLKVLYSTNDKTGIYLNKEIRIVLARTMAGYGKIILCDGYPKDILDSFGWNIARVLMAKRINTNTDPEEDSEFNIWSAGDMKLFVRASKRIVAVSDALVYQDIEATKDQVKKACKDSGYMLVDMTRENWVKTYFPELDEFFDKQDEYLMKQRGLSMGSAPRFPAKGEPTGGGGGGLLQ